MSLSLLAQTTTAVETCTLNGKIVDCEEAAQAVAGAAAGGLVFILFMMAFGVLNLIFFVLSLVHLLKAKDFKDRTLWMILIFFIPLASWIYYFVIRKNYEKAKQGQMAAPASMPPAPMAAPVETMQPPAQQPVSVVPDQQPAPMPTIEPTQQPQQITPDQNQQPPAGPAV